MYNKSEWGAIYLWLFRIQDELINKFYYESQKKKILF